MFSRNLLVVGKFILEIFLSKYTDFLKDSKLFSSYTRVLNQLFLVGAS